jgi:transposase-like protein
MQFAQPRCPNCQRAATHLVDTVLCHAAIEEVDAADDFEYDEQEATEIIWDTQTIYVDEQDRVQLHCDRCKQSWETEQIKEA